MKKRKPKSTAKKRNPHAISAKKRRVKIIDPNKKRPRKKKVEVDSD
jgi:hypothetical protein